MTTLNIYLLGQPKICWGEAPLQVERCATRTLLFYLASKTDPVGRSKLCELFWPNLPEKDARANLRGLLSKLKRSLPEPDLLQTRDDLVWLDQIKIYVDYQEYNQQWEQLKEIPWRYPENVALPQMVLDSLIALIGLWHGDQFLQDARLISSHAIDEWLTLSNGWLNTSRTMCLNRLAEHFSTSGQILKAVKYYRDILVYDEGNSMIYNKIVQCLIRGGYNSVAQSALEFNHANFQSNLENGLPAALLQTNELTASAEQLEAQVQRPVYPQEFSMHLNMIGREKALETIKATYKTGGALSISGESGIGKSLLVKEFYERYWPGVRLLLIRCTETGQNSPLQAMVEMLKKSIHAEEWKALPNLWANFLTLLIPDLSLLKPDLIIPERPTGNLGEGLVFEALVNLLTLVAQKERLLFVLDDAQWADVSTLSAIQHLVSSGFFKKHGALLIVCQNEESNSKLHNTLVALRRSGSINSLHLDFLTLDDTRALISQMLVNPPDEDFLTNFYHSTGGNPYIIIETIKEIVAHASSEKDLKFDHPLPISKSVQRLVSNKLERLDAHSLACLQAAAILGRTFERDTLTLMLDQPSALLSGSLHQLSFFGLIKPEGKTPSFNLLRFSYSLEQRTILSNLSAATKIDLHNRAAQALETIYRDQVDSHAARIATHYQMAENYPEALRWWLIAVKYAVKIYSKEAALQALAEVESILIRNPALISDEDACDFFIDKARFAYETNDISTLNQVSNNCLEMGKRRKSPLLIGAAHLGFSYYQFTINEYHQALSSIEKAATYLSVTNRKQLLAETYIRKGLILAYLQHFSASIIASDYAVSLAQEVHDPSVLELAFQAKAQKAYSLINIGNILDAYKEIDEAYTTYQDILRPFNHIRAHLAYCYCLVDLGRYQQTLVHLQQGLEISKSLGNLNFEIYFNLVLATIEIRKGNLDHARAIIADLTTQSEFIRHPDLFMRTQGVFSELHVTLHNFTEAEVVCKIATCNKLKNVHYFSILNRLAYCMASKGNYDGSKNIISEIYRDIESSDLGEIHDEAVINQAYIDLLQGRAEKVYRVLTDIVKKCVTLGRIEMSIMVKTMLMKAAGECGFIEEVDALQSQLCTWSEEQELPWVHLNVIPLWLQHTHQSKARQDQMIARSRQLLEQLEPKAQSEKIKESFLLAKEYWYCR